MVTWRYRYSAACGPKAQMHRVETCTTIFRLLLILLLSGLRNASKLPSIGLPWNQTLQNSVERDACAARKPFSKQNKAPMGHILSGAPIKKVCVDMLGPLPLTHQNNYIFFISDMFTKWIEAIPLPDQEALTVTKVFVETFVSRFGTRFQVHSDQGRTFELKLFQVI